MRSLTEIMRDELNASYPKKDLTLSAPAVIMPLPNKNWERIPTNPNTLSFLGKV